ncbi:MAG: hypothetical protein ABIJ96_16100 [Elusimicrobiota bacterium]
MAAEQSITYVDNQGKTHEVGSIGEVPQKYIRSMVIIGAEPAAETREELPAKQPGAAPTGSGMPGAPESMHAPLLAVAAVLLILVVRSKSFFLRVSAFLVAGAIGFYSLYTWMEGSGLLTTAEKKTRRVEAPQEE